MLCCVFATLLPFDGIHQLGWKDQLALDLVGVNLLGSTAHFDDAGFGLAGMIKNLVSYRMRVEESNESIHV